MAAFKGRLYIAWTTARNELRVAREPFTLHPWDNGTPLGESAHYGPALCVFHDRLYIAWTGTDDQKLLNVMSSADGLHFEHETKQVLQETSRHGPALAADEDALYLGWTGTDPLHQLNVRSSLDGLTWNIDDKAILEESSIASPALLFDSSGDFLMAWTDPARHIRVGQLHRGDDTRPPPDNSPWRVTGWTQIGHALPGQETLHGPSLAVLEFPNASLPRLAYSGTDDNHFIYIMFSEGDGENALFYPSRRQLEDSSPPDGPSMVAMDPYDASTFYLSYVRGDNHHLNLVILDPGD
jgi:hypothetical protein